MHQPKPLIVPQLLKHIRLCRSSRPVFRGGYIGFVKLREKLKEVRMASRRLRSGHLYDYQHQQHSIGISQWLPGVGIGLAAGFGCTGWSSTGSVELAVALMLMHRAPIGRRQLLRTICARWGRHLKGLTAVRDMAGAVGDLVDSCRARGSLRSDVMRGLRLCKHCKPWSAGAVRARHPARVISTLRSRAIGARSSW